MDTSKALNSREAKSFRLRSRGESIKLESQLSPSRGQNHDEILETHALNGDDVADSTRNLAHNNKSSINVFDSPPKGNSVDPDSSPLHKGSHPQNESAFDQSQLNLIPRPNTSNNLAKPTSTSAGYAKSLNHQIEKFLSWKSFGSAYVTMILILFGVICLETALFLKVSQVESNLVESTYYMQTLDSKVIIEIIEYNIGTNNNTDTTNNTGSTNNTVTNNTEISHDDTLLELMLSANIDQTNDLETLIIPDLQTDLSASIAKTNNLESVVIPAMQSSLTSNMNKLTNLENVVIPAIESSLLANIAKTSNLESVVIPAIESSLLSNMNNLTNLESVVIPAIETSLAANIAKATNLENVVIPSMQTSLAANVAKANNLESVVIAGVQTDLSATVAKTNNLENVVIAGIQSSASATFTKLETLEDIVEQFPTFYFGVTTGSWQAWTASSICKSVDITNYHFTNTPVVLTDISGNNNHWRTMGGSSIYDLSPTTFKVCLQLYDGVTPVLQDSANYNWQIQYVIFSTDP